MVRHRRRRRTLFRKRRRGTGHYAHKFIRYSTHPLEVDLALANQEYPESFGFGLSGVQGNAEFAALYDAYRIDYVEVIISWNAAIPDVLVVGPEFSSNVVSNSIIASQTMPIWILKDYNDVNDLNVAGMKEHSKAKLYTLRLNKPIKIFIKPAVRIPIFEGVGATTVTTSASTPRFSPKLDMLNGGITHYGIKTIIVTPSASQAPNVYFGKVRFEFRYHLSMYNAR